jgi:hypothetical protein
MKDGFARRVDGVAQLGLGQMRQRLELLLLNNVLRRDSAGATTAVAIAFKPDGPAGSLETRDKFCAAIIFAFKQDLRVYRLYLTFQRTPNLQVAHSVGRTIFC